MDAFQRMNRGEMKMKKLKERTMVCGWGHNDMVGMPGWRSRDCPFYGTWRSMLERRLNRYDDPTRRDVTVCEEWKFLSHFIAWAETQDYKGKQLDKDIRIPGNKGYRTDACLYVTPKINTLKLIEPRKYLDDHPYPQGVGLVERTTMPNGYYSQIGIDGENKRLGPFPTVDAASSAYCKAKSEYLRDLADSPDADCPITKEALLRWADIYELEVVYLRDNKR
jgi:hypothetical protein